MHGLHRGHYAELAESRYVFQPQMLRMLYTETSVTRPVLAGDLFVNIEYRRVRTVADRVDHHLQSVLVRIRDIPLHGRQNVRTRNAACARVVVIRLEEPRRPRSET